MSASWATRSVLIDRPEARGDIVVRQGANEPLDVRVGHPAVFAAGPAAFDVDRAASRTHHLAVLPGQRALGRIRAFWIDRTCTHGRPPWSDPAVRHVAGHGPS